MIAHNLNFLVTVGAYAPVSSAPDGERELFLRNLQAAVESAERDALLVAGGDYWGVRPPDSAAGVRDMVRGPFGILHDNRAGEAWLDVLVSCELRTVLSYFENLKRTSKDFFAGNFAAANGTWLHPLKNQEAAHAGSLVRTVTEGRLNAVPRPLQVHRGRASLLIRLYSDGK
jgi:hypothetical protein